MSIPTSDSAGIRQVIRALRATGHTLLSVDDGGEDIAVSNEREAVEAVTSVDEARLYVTLPDGKRTGWVFFVLGNSPDEVVCDYTINLDPTIENLMDTWV